MKRRYLQVTFRNGKPVAAYLYLQRQGGDRSVRTEKVDDGLLIDFAPDGRPIGVEIVSPQQLTLAALNAALQRFHEAPLTPEECKPLAA